jgi:FixJ family two-component response regulator
MDDRSRPATAPTVFVIDDDPTVRSALERLLRGAGWTVRTFASAEEFLRQDLQPLHGCLVADVHLGRMSGLELHATLGHRADAIPVILTSGVDDVNMELEAFRLGAVAFLRKPFEASAVLDSVRRGLCAGPHCDGRDVP